MDLKKRLITSFFTIILVPIILIGFSLWGFTQYHASMMEKTYNIDESEYDYLSSSVQTISLYTKSVYEQLAATASNSPDYFSNSEYLDKINTELTAKYSYLVVKIGNNICYTGTLDDVSDIVSTLPSYGNAKTNLDMGTYIGDNIKVLIKQVDFSLTDGSDGSAFIVTPLKNVLPQVKTLLMQILISILLILVFTSGVLTMWIYKGILNPLRKLKVATQHIKDGNLDFTIETDADDEIGELCNDFEEMRQRLKASAEEKIEYDRESKELVSNISHDLKTPITAVKGYVEGIMDGVADTPEKMDKYIRTIYNKANEMDSLINELTFYSKIDTNKIPYTFTKINVAQYFEDCIEELNLDLESKNIDLAYFNYVDTDVIVIADSEQLARVINNIVGNSIKYIDKSKGYINIRIKDVGDFIQIEIEDNGKGIAQKDLQYIFDRFYRTDASRNSSQGGSGIGLSIVKKIIEDHGGKIWATSKESIGTVMYFVLRKYQEVPVNEQDTNS